VIRNLLAYAGIGPAPSSGFSSRQQDIARAIVEYRTKYLQWLDISDGSDDTPDYVNAYTPFQNVDMLKNISLARDETTGTFVFDAANPPLSAEEMDLLRPHITVSSGYARGGAPWLGVGALETNMVSGADDPSGNETELYVANLSDASRIGVGSTVWFQWSGLSEFRTVLAKNGCGRPLVLAADCTALDTSIDLQWAPGFVGASASTPCYIKIDDEWIMYTDVTVDDEDNPTILTLENCARGQFGTVAAAHLRGLAYVDGAAWSPMRPSSGSRTGTASTSTPAPIPSCSSPSSTTSTAMAPIQ